MGLNLNIHRIFFTTLQKYNGYSNNPINNMLFKQISGRAGRFGLYKEGYIGILNDEHHLFKNKKTIYKLGFAPTNKQDNQIDSIIKMYINGYEKSAFYRANTIVHQNLSLSFLEKNMKTINLIKWVFNILDLEGKYKDFLKELEDK